MYNSYMVEIGMEYIPSYSEKQREFSSLNTWQDVF